MIGSEEKRADTRNQPRIYWYPRLGVVRLLLSFHPTSIPSTTRLSTLVPTSSIRLNNDKKEGCWVMISPRARIRTTPIRSYPTRTTPTSLKPNDYSSKPPTRCSALRIPLSPHTAPQSVSAPYESITSLNHPHLHQISIPDPPNRGSILPSRRGRGGER